ncbi:MAG: caspase family protein [Chitinophagaceae bacterium]|nr:caspase family protein [Chitinophagaceae bacterium]
MLQQKFYCFLLSLSLTAINIVWGQQTKHALIFGIGDYKYWPRISSKNDIPFIQSAFLKQGFRTENIIIVTDSNATITGLHSAFKILTGNIKPGDVVVIHFSSHGEQVEDDNNDEADGLDEAIVSYDATLPADVKDFAKEQQRYFRDDQFGNYINQLRSKLGKNGDVVVFIDACHSGSGTRGTRKVRGGAPPLISRNFKAPGKETVKPVNVFLEGNSAEEDEQNLATYVVISAARAEELNTETDNNGTDMGSLSYAISKVFETLAPGTTYRSLFSGILSVMNDIVPQQHPVLEGNGLDRELFGGKFVEQKPFVEIEAVNKNLLTLKGGLLMGLDSGAKVALYPAGTNDPGAAVPLASGIISAAKPFSASVVLDKNPGLLQPSAGWVFITEPAYRIKPLVIGIGSANAKNKAFDFSASEEAGIRSILKEIPLVQTRGNPELLLIKGPEKDSLKLAANGYLFSMVDRGNKKDLQEQIRRYAQYKFLEKLQITDPSCKVDVKLVPIIDGKADKSKINQKIVNGIYEFNVNDSLVIWVKNKGDKTVYLNILDIQPDGIINPLLPNTGLKPPIYPGDLKVLPGQEILFQNYIIQIAPPTGMETFKIFVSETEINLEGIAAGAGTMSRGNFTVLETLVNNSYQVATRGAKMENITKTDGSTYNLLFRIKPAKK